MHTINKRGFTLLEVLLVVAIIAILAGIVIVAINPTKQLGDSRDTQRRADVNTVMSALYQYAIDNNGVLPTGVATGTAKVLGTAASGCDSTCGATTTAAACLDVSSSLVATYVSSIPLDPQNGSAANTDYYVVKNAAGRVIVGSCDPEEESSISITR